MKQAQTQFPCYEDMVTRSQRHMIDNMICSSFRASLGHNVDTVEYTVRHSAVRSGIRYIDMEAQLKGHRIDFHVAIANHLAVPYFCDLRARDMYNGHDCGEKHVTLPQWMLTMKAGAWRYKFRRP